jgi:hypothetical protein
MIRKGKEYIYKKPLVLIKAFEELKKKVETSRGLSQEQALSCFKDCDFTDNIFTFSGYGKCVMGHNFPILPWVEMNLKSVREQLK